MERGTTATQPDRAEETDKTARVRGARGPPTCPLPRTDGSLYVRPGTGLVLVLHLTCLIRVLPPFLKVTFGWWDYMEYSLHPTVQGPSENLKNSDMQVLFQFFSKSWRAMLHGPSQSNSIPRSIVAP